MKSDTEYGTEASRLAESIRAVYETIVRLRSPDGCPWDRKQTPKSLRSSLLEEAYEAVAAINSERSADIAEELGDVLLLILMIARIFEESGKFDASRISDVLNEKLIRRHPHVFGDATVTDADEVVLQWNQIKVEIEGKRKKTSVLDAVSDGLPPLKLAEELQKKAAKTGFDWPESDGIREKLHEEIDELCDAIAAGGNESAKKDTTSDSIEDELGDVLFSVVNLARWYRIDPMIALSRTNDKFRSRFEFVERKMIETGTDMSPDTLDVMERYWQQAKDMG
jgi:tetrapyrrole methylase family protein/MazG family protein